HTGTDCPKIAGQWCCQRCSERCGKRPDSLGMTRQARTAIFRRSNLPTLASKASRLILAPSDFSFGFYAHNHAWWCSRGVSKTANQSFGHYFDGIANLESLTGHVDRGELLQLVIKL